MKPLKEIKKLVVIEKNIEDLWNQIPWDKELIEYYYTDTPITVNKELVNELYDVFIDEIIYQIKCLLLMDEEDREEILDIGELDFSDLEENEDSERPLNLFVKFGMEVVNRFTRKDTTEEIVEYLSDYWTSRGYSYNPYYNPSVYSN